MAFVAPGVDEPDWEAECGAERRRRLLGWGLAQRTESCGDPCTQRHGALPMLQRLEVVDAALRGLQSPREIVCGDACDRP